MGIPGILSTTPAVFTITKHTQDHEHLVYNFNHNFTYLESYTKELDLPKLSIQLFINKTKTEYNASKYLQLSSWCWRHEEEIQHYSVWSKSLYKKKERWITYLCVKFWEESYIWVQEFTRSNFVNIWSCQTLEFLSKHSTCKMLHFIKRFPLS